jgi:hypothetical protein
MIQHGSCGWVCHPQLEQSLKISPWVSFGSHYTTGIVDSITTAGRVQVLLQKKCWGQSSYLLLVGAFAVLANYPPVIKHGNRTSPKTGSFKGKCYLL